MERFSGQVILEGNLQEPLSKNSFHWPTAAYLREIMPSSRSRIFSVFSRSKSLNSSCTYSSARLININISTLNTMISHNAPKS